MVEPGPEFSVKDVFNGWVRAFTELGCEVRRFQLADRLTYHEIALRGKVPEDERPQMAAWAAAEGLAAECYTTWPDVVVIVSAFFVPPDLYGLLRARGHKVVVLLTESPYEDSSQYGLAQRADLAIINDPTNLDVFRQIQPNTFYLPHAYDPKIHHRRAPERDLFCDVGWVGTAYPSRISWMESVPWGDLNVALAGNWQNLDPDSPLNDYLVSERPEWCFDNEDTVRLYSSARSSFNTYRVEAAHPELSEGWAMGPREVELAAVECFYLTEERGENRAVLPMVPTFSGPGDYIDKLRWWLDHPTEMDEVTTKAREAIADRTFTNHAAELLRRLNL